MPEKKVGTVTPTHIVVKGKMYPLKGDGDLVVELNDDGSLTLK